MSKQGTLYNFYQKKRKETETESNVELDSINECTTPAKRQRHNSAPTPSRSKQRQSGFIWAIVY